ncbi:hypothetical protein [Mechercharimyces sp. CAU 1602]|uniref:hypothetical protein n=1 Tax=Mechercharimyces sp. CAU 1602 TaxID=2973933 RepID=UPI0021615A2C|nr:hypothetical protein [Mechercharimyces sp. CAU 1602]MCS1352771.1 hypothetical protein [Mechercharimyces sp. CAU 1602]
MTKKLVSAFMTLIMVFTLMVPLAIATPSEELEVKLDLVKGKLNAHVLPSGQTDGFYSYSIYEKGGNRASCDIDCTPAGGEIAGARLDVDISTAIAKMDMKKSYEIYVEYKFGEQGPAISKTIDLVFPDKMKIDANFNEKTGKIKGKMMKRDLTYGMWNVFAKKKGEGEKKISLLRSDKKVWNKKEFKADISDALFDLEAGEYTLTVKFTELFAGGLKRDSNKVKFNYVVEEVPNIDIMTIPLYDDHGGLEGYDVRASINDDRFTDQVKGTWYYKFIDEQSSIVVDEDVSDHNTGYQWVNIYYNTPGKYTVQVDFAGTNDGKPVELTGEKELIIPNDSDSSTVGIDASHSFVDFMNPEGGVEDVMAVIDVELYNLPAGEVDGTWTFEVVDKDNFKTYKGQEKQSVQYSLEQFKELEMGKGYEIIITFSGKVGKEHDIEVSTSYVLPIPGFETNYECKDGKITLSGAVLNGKYIEGDWYFNLWKDEKHVAGGELLDHSGQLQASYTFDQLGAADLATITFEGMIDEEEIVLWSVLPVNEGCKADPGDSTTVITNPDDGKEIVDDIKGGKLPSTATEEPKGMLYGLIVAVLGLMVLGFVFRSRIVAWFR